ncbi:hypothetical protein [Aliiroseovarius sp. S253]|uniref:hypothetical protein n=1 Tax=Aliiroseovarius sp. S253 TaxID=3415133 RepID=UPI003C7D63B4
MTIKRRNFLTMLGAAATAPLIPARALSAAPAAAVGYNRYQYGLAVFHARTRASLGVADLMSRLNVTGATAEAMMAEMKSSGIIAPVLNSAAGAMRAISPNSADPRSITERLATKAGQMMRDTLTDCEGEQPPQEVTEIQSAPEGATQETENGKV